MSHLLIKFPCVSTRARVWLFVSVCLSVVVGAVYLCVLSRCLHVWWGGPSVHRLRLRGEQPGLVSVLALRVCVRVFMRTHMSVCISVSVSVSVASLCLCLGVRKHLCVSVCSRLASSCSPSQGVSRNAPNGSGMGAAPLSTIPQPSSPHSLLISTRLALRLASLFHLTSHLLSPHRPLYASEGSQGAQRHLPPGAHPISRSQERAAWPGHHLGKQGAGWWRSGGRLRWHEAPPGTEL